MLKVIHLSTQFLDNPAINFDRSHQPPNFFFIFLSLLDIFSKVAHDSPQKNEDIIIGLGQNLTLIDAKNGNPKLDENLPPKQNEKMPKFIHDCGRQVL